VIGWTYQEEEFDSIPEGALAFVYYLEFEDGTKYVGKKNFYSTSRKRQPGKSRRTVTVRESNWKSYLSSSETVKSKLKAGEKLVRREVLHLCKTLGQATYMELHEQVQRNVLCNPEYLNGLIYAKVMRCGHVDYVDV
jgi:hypothetical protein